jgi:hypothetical protein
LIVALGTKGVTVSVGMRVALGTAVGVWEAVGMTIVAEGITEVVIGAGVQEAVITKTISRGDTTE